MECKKHLKNLNHGAESQTTRSPSEFSCAKCEWPSTDRSSTLRLAQTTSASVVASLQLGAPSLDQVQKKRALPSRRLSDANSFNDDEPFIKNMEEIDFWIETTHAPCLYKDTKFKKGLENGRANWSKIKLPKNNSTSSSNKQSPRKRQNKRKLAFPDNTNKAEVRVAKTNRHGYEAYSKAVAPAQHKGLTNQKNQQKKKRTAAKIKPAKKNLRNVANVEASTSRQEADRNPITIVTSTPKLVKVPHQSNELVEISSEHDSDDLNLVINVRNTSAMCRQNGPVDAKMLVHRPGNNKTQSPQAIGNVKKYGETFDDMSDVSGLTASYIRSTKLNHTKGQRRPPCVRKSHTKVTNNGRQKSQLAINNNPIPSPSRRAQQKSVVCVNRSTNTGEGSKGECLANCSSDSSANIMNILTIEAVNHNLKDKLKSSGVDKSTSLLNFIVASPQREPSAKRQAQSSKVNAAPAISGTALNGKRVTPAGKKLNSPGNNDSPYDRVPRRAGNNCKSTRIEAESKCITRNQTKRNLMSPKAPPVTHTTDNKNYANTRAREKEADFPMDGGAVSSDLPQGDMGPISNKKKKNTPKELQKPDVNWPDACKFILNEWAKRKRKLSVSQTLGSTSGSATRSRNTSALSSNRTKDKSAFSSNPHRERSGFSACFSDSEDDTPPVKKKFK